MSKYAETGVDVKKKGTEVFKSSIKNLFPGAFCVITQDPDFHDYGQIHHSDGNGSKDVVRYLIFKESGDISVFKDSAVDVLAMNLGDLLCVGGYPTSFTDYVSINKEYVLKEDFLRELNKGLNETIGFLNSNGLEKLTFSGGETADLPYQTKTLDVSGDVYGRVRLSEVISGDKIEQGNFIVGIRSGGRCRFEKGLNSGIMSNGLTLAWHCLLTTTYNELYPETTEIKLKPYYGKLKVDAEIAELGTTIGEALTCPTRLFAPIAVKILERYRPDITGIVHNTGGGQTKCLRLGRNVLYVKDNLPGPDPIFGMIQSASGESWKDMYSDYNMGIGLDVFVVDARAANEVIGTVEKEFGVEAQVVGHVEKSDGTNKLRIKSPHGDFSYP
jgi:phosphoribosylformylglycinamidine cyclo-ligase